MASEAHLNTVRLYITLLVHSNAVPLFFKKKQFTNPIPIQVPNLALPTRQVAAPRGRRGVRILAQHLLHPGTRMRSFVKAEAMMARFVLLNGE